MESLTRINDNFLESLIGDVVDTKDIQSAKQLLYNLKEPTPLPTNPNTKKNTPFGPALTR